MPELVLNSAHQGGSYTRTDSLSGSSGSRQRHEGAGACPHRCYMSMSLDGYITGPHAEPGNPGGDGFMRLHQWYFADGESGRPSGPAGEVVDRMNATGGVLVGRRTAEQVDNYKGDHHGVLIFGTQPLASAALSGGLPASDACDRWDR